MATGIIGADAATRVPKYGMGKNLLDNWYFGNPVNQRGEASYSTDGAYTIDRWYLGGNSGTAAFDAEGLDLSHSTAIAQFFEKSGIISGAKYTLSVLKSNGLMSATGTLTVGESTDWQIVILTPGVGGACAVRQSSSEQFQVAVWGDGTNKIKAIKLELGTEQTLCHNEGTAANPVWVLNAVPDYADELVRGQLSTADSLDSCANKDMATTQQIAQEQTGPTANRAYTANSYFCWNGSLYRVTTAISSGATLTPDTNCVQTTVMDEIVRLMTN